MRADTGKSHCDDVLPAARMLLADRKGRPDLCAPMSVLSKISEREKLLAYVTRMRRRIGVQPRREQTGKASAGTMQWRSW